MDDVNKTREQRIAELLDKPAQEVVNGIKGPSLSDLTQPEPKTEEEVADDEEETSKDKKIRIRASRLKTLEDELASFRSQAEALPTLQERIAQLESRSNANADEELPAWWKESYGDDEVSKQGYKNQQRIMREEMQSILREQESQRLAEEEHRSERIEQIEQSFDDQMEQLEETLGRDLTATQKAELLDIVGEYSPQEDGQYVAYIPVEKAYDIWQKGQGQNPAKREMANIAGIQSSGSSTSTPSAERPQWGDWRKRFGN